MNELPDKDGGEAKETPARTWRMRIEGFDRLAGEGDKLPVETEVLSFSHGIYWGGESYDHRPEMGEMSVVRPMDAASPLIMRLCLNADVLPRVEILLTSPEPGGEDFVIRFDLVNARVTSVRPGGSASGGDERPLEEVSFAFERMRYEVRGREGKGTATLVSPE